MTEKEILQYAIKGITAEIEELEKSVRKGYELVKQIEQGQKVKTPKTKQEILEICHAKKAEIEKLDKERFDLRWKVDVEMEN